MLLVSIKGFKFHPIPIGKDSLKICFHEETDDQLQAIEDIKRDMESDRVMDRLLCGDVGWEDRGCIQQHLKG